MVFIRLWFNNVWFDFSELHCCADSEADGNTFNLKHSQTNVNNLLFLIVHYPELSAWTF